MREKIAQAILVLRELFPNGHERFIPEAVGDIALHSIKNKDYGGDGDPLGNFKRVATFLAQYPGLDITDPTVVALVYMCKQLDAVFQLLATGSPGVVEGVQQRLGDVSVYAKLASILYGEQVTAPCGPPAVEEVS